MRKGRLVAIALGLLLSSCAGNDTAEQASQRDAPARSAEPVSPRDVTARGNRAISIDVGPDSSGDFEKALALAKSAGAEHIGLFQDWVVLEPSPGKYDGSWLDIANGYYHAQGLRLDLTLAPINTNRKRFPPDLQGKDFDDPLVIERFKRLVDFVLSRLSKVSLSTLNIGSEMDIFFGTDRRQWQRYEVFYKSVSAHIKQKRPGVLVVTEPTFKGLMETARDPLKSINQFSDAIAVSYYSMLDNGNVKEPTVVQQDFDALVRLYPDKPIFFLQFGYPSSTALNSSEAKQAEFVRQAFRAWDRHADRIRLIDFTWLHDSSPSSVKELGQFYGLSDRKFSEFIGTLGLRLHRGEDKEAFKALRAESGARGFGGGSRAVAPATPLPTSGGRVALGFSKADDLWDCPAGDVALDAAGGAGDGQSAMRWSFMYGQDWLWCTRTLPGGTNLDGVKNLEVKVRSDRQGPIFLQVAERDGEAFFAVIDVSTRWQSIRLDLSRLSVDPDKRQDGRLDVRRISQLLLADNGGADKKQGRRTLWFSGMALAP